MKDWINKQKCVNEQMFQQTNDSTKRQKNPTEQTKDVNKQTN